MTRIAFALVLLGVAVGLLLFSEQLARQVQPQRAAGGPEIPATSLPAGQLTGSIVFVSDREGQAAVYIMRADGKPPRRLTHNRGEDAWPSFSPDGTRIVYETKVEGTAQIMLMDRNGENEKQLTSGSSNEFPSWSHDGSHIAFASNRDGHVAVYSMNPDGSGVQLLTDHPSDNWFPVWSPNDARLAFVSDRDGTHGNIYILAADGSSLRQLTANPILAAKPSWSPDATRLAVFAEGGIFTIASDGQDYRQLTGEGEDPAWSPDGRWIAFASRRGTDHLQLYITPPDSSSTVRLTDGPANDWAPSWGR